MVNDNSSPILDDEFDFKDIFPLCKINFKAIEIEDNTTYANVCNNISNAIGDSNLTFVDTCKKVSLYLKHIKDGKYANHIKPSCLYFNYMLKDALDKYAFTCNNTEQCYQKMITEYSKDNKNELNICEVHVKDFKNDTFVVLNKLNTLYDNFLYNINYKGDKNICDAAEECLKIYSPFSEICQKGNNKSFCKVLQNFQAQYNDQMNKVTICNEALKYLPSPYGTNMRIIIISLFIITFAISAIIFILYKCTPCGSYIRPRKKKLNKLWNNEGRHLKLKYPLDKSSKTSSGENYQISYNSAEYSL
ncbi:unnamed protein product [Plasmodium vivax]|uniref:(malaria parasite P. vivax) hypothetical protein n=1 Tax=Plasmodium vivax TaxID=5855 RepID=A0A8S4HE69_PLAVI|nr:unnamed protein product [Plasmodium vivax]CAI7721778.1 PIR protein [Plasmodium vivax]